MILNDKMPFCTADNGLAPQRPPSLCLVASLGAAAPSFRQPVANILSLARIKATMIGPNKTLPIPPNYPGSLLQV